MPHMLRRALIAPLALCLVTACSDDSSSGGSGGSAGGGNDPCGGAGETFTAGIEKPGAQGRLSFELMDSNPAPPQVGDNRWTLSITDAAGTAVEGSTVNVSPWMPAHKHPSPKQPAVTDEGGGSYVAEPVNFNMPGVWEITIDATPATGDADSAMFAFCIGQ